MARTKSTTKPVQTDAPETTDVVAEAEAVTAEAAKENAKTRKAKERVLSDERAEWVAANARPAVASCLCGCGGETKGRFVPGHDALLKVALEATVAHGEGEAKASAEQALATFGW